MLLILTCDVLHRLPPAWDQLAFWAITVGTNIAGYVPLFGGHVRNLMLADGGRERRAAAYVLHIYFIPALIPHPVASTGGSADGFAVSDRRPGRMCRRAACDPKEVADVDAY